MLDPNVMGLTGIHFMEFIFPLYHNFTRAVDIPMVLHICGNVGKILDYIPGTGFAAFSFDYPSVSLESVIKAFGAKIKIIGSVPTISHLLNGTREDVFRISLQMIDSGVDFLAPSCFLAPETPLENVKAMIEAIEYRNGKAQR